MAKIGNAERLNYEAGNGSCVIRVLGDQFDPSSFLNCRTLPVLTVFHRGVQRSGRRKAYSTSGFSCDLGTGDFGQLLRIASEFLETYMSDFHDLSSFPGVESSYIDILYPCRLGDQTIAIQTEFLTSRFIQLAADAKLEIALRTFHEGGD